LGRRGAFVNSKHQKTAKTANQITKTASGKAHQVVRQSRTTAQLQATKVGKICSHPTDLKNGVRTEPPPTPMGMLDALRMMREVVGLCAVNSLLRAQAQPATRSVRRIFFAGNVRKSEAKIRRKLDRRRSTDVPPESRCRAASFCKGMGNHLRIDQKDSTRTVMTSAACHSLQRHRRSNGLKRSRMLNLDRFNTEDGAEVTALLVKPNLDASTGDLSPRVAVTRESNMMWPHAGRSGNGSNLYWCRRRPRHPKAEGWTGVARWYRGRPWTPQVSTPEREQTASNCNFRECVVAQPPSVAPTIIMAVPVDVMQHAKQRSCQQIIPLNNAQQSGNFVPRAMPTCKQIASSFKQVLNPFWSR
jgi:hypothetical protein